MARELWHSISIEEAFNRTESSASGITETEAKQRLSTYGLNELPREKDHPAWKLFLGQFNSPLMYIMLAATGVSLFMENYFDSLFIFIVLSSNALLGFYQEYKANASVLALKQFIKRRARIIRNSTEHEVDATTIVPGDIVILRAGDHIPADGRIIEARGLKVNEANLTGESRPIEKTAGTLEESIELGDRTNMVFVGTLVEEGSATILVVETGLRTEYGDIVALLKDTPEEKTPLQKVIVSLSKIVGIFITCTVGIIIIEGILVGRDTKEVFASALALFVSGIPEGILPAVTIILVLGMRRILKHNGLVRRLAATETLGGVTVICTDKTGTLTEGIMSVSHIITADQELTGSALEATYKNWTDIKDSTRFTLHSGLLSNDSYVENPHADIDHLIVRGNSTEQALVKAAHRLGIYKHEMHASHPVIDMLFFSSDRKYSASIRTDSDNTDTPALLYVMGAPERIFERAAYIYTSHGVRPSSDAAYAALIARAAELTKQGYRVIATAYRVIHDIPGTAHENKSSYSPDTERLTDQLVMTGIIALEDPVRQDVRAAFEQTRAARIRTVIVTGDHKYTALAVAEKIGFTIKPEDIVEGHEIEQLSDEELHAKVRHVALYARVSPRHKLRIVKAFQDNGEVVAMFGDGVNDAPALKAADIGVAVRTEVDAVREVADIMLLDGGFNTIVKAVEQGRIIFDNIRKVFLYLITQDFSQFFLFIFAITFRLPLPLLPIQLLVVNLVESGLPDLALTTEQEKDGVMNRPPRNPKETVLNKTSLRWMISIFVISGSIATMFYYTALKLTGSVDHARTMMLLFMSLESLFLVFSVRSFGKSILRWDIFSNKLLTGAVILSFGMVMAAIYVPALQKLFTTEALLASEVALIFAANICEIALIDIFKRMFFREEHMHEATTHRSILA